MRTNSSASTAFAAVPAASNPRSPGAGARTGLSLGVLVLMTAPLAACALPQVCVRPSGLRSVAINSQTASNGGRPIAVDLVYVTAKPVAAAVSKLKARDYFALHDQLVRDYPQTLRAQRWEIQAGQQVLATKVSPPCGLAGTYLFANFHSDGDHRIAVGKAKAGVLNLGEDEIVWTPK